MGPTACRRGRPVPRPLGRGSGVLGVGFALVAFLYGSSAAPLGECGRKSGKVVGGLGACTTGERGVNRYRGVLVLLGTKKRSPNPLLHTPPIPQSHVCCACSYVAAGVLTPRDTLNATSTASSGNLEGSDCLKAACGGDGGVCIFQRYIVCRTHWSDQLYMLKLVHIPT